LIYTERDFKTVFSIESVDLSFLAKSFAEQYEKQLASQPHGSEINAEYQLAT